MDTAKAQQIILTSGVVTFGLGIGASFVDSKDSGKPDFPSSFHARMFVGAGFVYVGLSIVSQFAPAPAGYLAALIALTAVFTNGAPVINYLLSVTGYDPNAKDKKKSKRKAK